MHSERRGWASFGALQKENLLFLGCLSLYSHFQFPRRFAGLADPSLQAKIFCATRDSLFRMKRPPNILITGTPGTGKSSLAESLQHNFDGLTHLNISDIIKERKLGESYNPEWDTWEFDDDKVFVAPEK